MSRTSIGRRTAGKLRAGRLRSWMAQRAGIVRITACALLVLHATYADNCMRLAGAACAILFIWLFM